MPPQLQPTPSLRTNSFLSPTTYDDDASSIRSPNSRSRSLSPSPSDQETDSEDDEVLLGARTSADIRAHDRNVLLEEEERDQLLIEEKRRKGRRGSGLEEFVGRLFSKNTAVGGRLAGQDAEKRVVDEKSTGKGKTERRRRRRERRRGKKERLLENAEHGEDGELMHEMEEGGMKEGSSTGESSDSDDVDRRGLRRLQNDKSSRRRRWRNWCFIHLLIAVGFAILVLVAYKLSRNRNVRAVKQGQKYLSNGTALFAPTTILISLDGFRADFLNRGITPRLNAFVKEGVSPLYMRPSFPSVTFPNHYTIATGLYPESHGIVGNTFWDVDLHEEFYYTHPDAMQPKWWGGEPIWVTAERQGIRTAIHMWPGSEAHIAGVEPAFLDKFNGKELLPNKVSRVLELLDRPGDENAHALVDDMRPQFIAAYVPNVDGDGHRYGPNSTEIMQTIANVDTMLDQLFHGLEQRNLTNIVNVVVVSDHGMATTDISRVIQLESLIDTSLIAHTDGWPLYGLRPKDPKDLQPLYDTLAAAAAKNPNFEVYLRDKNMPERYHFSKNERIAPLWIVPKTGWAIASKKEFDVEEAKKTGRVYKPRGLHGYDHEHPLMRAIFVARGPAFPHIPGSKVEPFQNIEIYNIVCDSLSLDPRPNNGTLRLPLKTTGLHRPEHPNLIPTPADDGGMGMGMDNWHSNPDDVQSAKDRHSSLLKGMYSAASSLAAGSVAQATATASVIAVPADPVGEGSKIASSKSAANDANPQASKSVVVGVDVPKPTDGNVGSIEPGKNANGDVNTDRPTVEDDSTSKEGGGKDGGFKSWLEKQIEKMKGWIEGLVGGEKEKGKEGGS